MLPQNGGFARGSFDIVVCQTFARPVPEPIGAIGKISRKKTGDAAYQRPQGRRSVVLDVFLQARAFGPSKKRLIGDDGVNSPLERSRTSAHIGRAVVHPIEPCLRRHKANTACNALGIGQRTIELVLDGFVRNHHFDGKKDRAQTCGRLSSQDEGFHEKRLENVVRIAEIGINHCSHQSSRWAPRSKSVSAAAFCVANRQYGCRRFSNFMRGRPRSAQAGRRRAKIRPQ